MSIQINASNLRNIRFSEPDMVRSVIQNIALILSTRRGSVPLQRDFGLDWSALDKPLPIAKSMLIAQIREAIETWEPRATFVKASFGTDLSSPATFITAVEVEINHEPLL